MKCVLFYKEGEDSKVFFILLKRKGKRKRILLRYLYMKKEAKS